MGRQEGKAGTGHHQCLPPHQGRQAVSRHYDIVNPNGLAFSPDKKKLYVVEWKGTPNRSIWGFDVNADGTVGGKTKLIDAADQGALDGFRVDRDGNLWCGWGSNGALQSEPADVGSRKVFQLKGKPRISTA